MSLFDDPDYKKMQQAYQEGKLAYEKKCDEYWNSLDYEDKLKAFYSVVKRIHDGEVRQEGSYRYVLYDVFGFDMDAYAIGMECGYLDLHNRIMREEEYANYCARLRNPDGSTQL